MTWRAAERVHFPVCFSLAQAFTPGMSLSAPCYRGSDGAAIRSQNRYTVKFGVLIALFFA